MFTLANIACPSVDHVHVAAVYTIKMVHGEARKVYRTDGTYAGFICATDSVLRNRKVVKSASFFQLRECGCLVQAMDVASHKCRDHLKPGAGLDNRAK